MAKFKGIGCPVCAAAFKEEDDIVVCPYCGTPHHRHCYTENNKCKNLELHADGFIWKSPVDNAIQGYKVKEEREIAEAEALGETFQNSADAKDISSFREFLENNGINRQNYEKGKERFEKRDIYGVSEREIICFQGGTNPFLIEKYHRIANGYKASLNFFAMLFFPYTTFYSRMRFIGIISVIVDFLLQLPYTILMFSQDINIFQVTGGTDTDMSKLWELNAGFKIVQFIIRILVLVFYDYIYLKWMTYKIKEIRSRFIKSDDLSDINDKLKTLGEDYYVTLSLTGKPSFLRMLLDSLATTCGMGILLFLVLSIGS